MSVKRKDRKGRILRAGETQRKDGRYMYKYVGSDGKNKYVYSSRLTAGDPVLEGNKEELSLREKIAEIEKNKILGVNIDNKITVRKAVKSCIDSKNNIRENTIKTYKYIYKLIDNSEIADMLVGNIKTSYAKGWIRSLQTTHGKNIKTIKIIYSLLKQTFQELVEDDLILKNPFNFKISTIVANDEVKREALSEYDEKVFLNFIRNDSFYYIHYGAIYILLNTGLRISELCGLTINDIDFKNNTISVNHQIVINRYNKPQVVDNLKSKSSVREIPMIKQVKHFFEEIIDKTLKSERILTIDNYTGFLFLTKRGTITNAKIWEYRFNMIVRKYNSTHEYQLPKITPHVCRHTFCSRMANSGINPKTLQYIMGHSTIGITLNTYSHINSQEAKKEIERISGCL